VFLGDFHFFVAADALKFYWRYPIAVSVSTVSDFGFPPIDKVAMSQFQDVPIIFLLESLPVVLNGSRGCPLSTGYVGISVQFNTRLLRFLQELLGRGWDVFTSQSGLGTVGEPHFPGVIFRSCLESGCHGFFSVGVLW
jgi:hypothetical protein